MNQAFVSLLGGDLDARVPARRPPLGSLVSVAGPVPELHWHAAVATDAGREDVVAALTGGFSANPSSCAAPRPSGPRCAKPRDDGHSRDS